MPELSKQRLHINIQGAVQGVGFRPFIYRLATELGLVGWVNNSAEGVVIEVEGIQVQLHTFMLRIEQDKPLISLINSLESTFLAPIGDKKFEIRASTGGEMTALILPDLATCSDCRREIFTPGDRRYLYPFTNCTNCGPRFSIIEGLPYDRPNTTMKKFQMCEACQAEYENPLHRRFHAQPNACSKCGPHLELWNRDGKVLVSDRAALTKTAEEIRQGKIIAVKGLGGFHLVVDARNQKAIKRLRHYKLRAAKPFALMYPSLELVKSHCEVTDLAERLLLSPQAPIVLLCRKLDAKGAIAPTIAPGNPYLGVMLPYTALHHLLMAELGFPIVATSGNISDEPICIDEYQALQRLGSTADFFLVHNRPIACPVDDSVVRVIMGREMVLRRARGYAPLPIPVNAQAKILAVGAQVKNAIAVSVNKQVFVSQHIGDLETVPAFEAFKDAITFFEELYELQPIAIACDAHPDYYSTQFAQKSGLTVIPVQHHYAHVLSCMAENALIETDNSKTVLGIAWDGTGYGLNGTIWGGEFLQIKSLQSLASNTEIPFQRVAHLRTFRLLGGEKAIKEPRRVAISLLFGNVRNQS